MSDQNSQPAVMAQLQSLLLTTTDVTDFLHQLAALCTQVVTTESLSCGITIRYSGKSHLAVASSDKHAEQLDESQYRNHAGPCMESMDTNQLVLSQDCRHESRWPDYITMAVHQGLRCSMSLPLAAAGTTFGAMNVYGFGQPHLFGPTEQRQLQLFAAQASGALQLATRQIKDAELLTQLEEALNSRSVIDQALGILIGRHQLTAVEAFDLLRRQSQNSHRKIRDIATDLVTQTSGEPPTLGRPFGTA